MIRAWLATLGWLWVCLSISTGDSSVQESSSDVAFVIMTHNRPAELAQLLYNITELDFVDTLRAAGFSRRLVIAESCGTCHRETHLASSAAIDFFRSRFQSAFLTVDHILTKDFRQPFSGKGVPTKLLSRSHSKRNAQMNLYGGLTCALTGREADTAVILEDDILLAPDFASVLVRMLQTREPTPPHHVYSASNTSGLCRRLGNGVQRTDVDPNFMYDMGAAASEDVLQAKASTLSGSSAAGHAGSMGLKWRPSLVAGNADWQMEAAMVPHSQHTAVLESVHVTPRVVFRVLGWHVSRQLWRGGLASQLLSSAIWEPPVPQKLVDLVATPVDEPAVTKSRMRPSTGAPAMAPLEALTGVDFFLASDTELTVGLAPAALEWASAAQWPGFAQCSFCDNYCHDHVVEEAVRGGGVLAPLVPRVSQRAGVVGMSEDGSLDEMPTDGSQESVGKPVDSLRWLSPRLPIPGVSSWNVLGALRMGCHVTLQMDLPDTTAADGAEAGTPQAQLQVLWTHLVLPLKQDSFQVACPTHMLPWTALSMPFVQLVAALVSLAALSLALCCFNRKLAFCWRCRWALNGWVTSKPKRG